MPSISPKNPPHSSRVFSFEGIVNFIAKQHEDADSESLKRWAASFTRMKTCPKCDGTRIRLEARHFKLADKNIAQISALDFKELQAWFSKLPGHLSEKQSIIATEIIKEVSRRI